MITYDDPHSLGLKGAMARDKGIAGVLMVSTSLSLSLLRQSLSACLHRL